MLTSIIGSLLATSFLFVGQAQAATPVAQVVDASNFCTFLPPSDSTDRVISDTEWNAQVFCMGNTPLAVGAGKIPDGFIQSAHFVATDDYVQVTGQIEPSKANLDVTDWGGQYDIKAPNPSACAGYNFYVNLVEPASYTYCIRCCNDESNCNRGISEKGCAHIIPGDYSGPISGATIDAGEAAADAAVSNGGAAASNGNAAPAASATPGNSSGGDSTSPAANSDSSNSKQSNVSSSPAQAASTPPAAAPSSSSSPAGASSAGASSAGASASSAPPAAASGSAGASSSPGAQPSDESVTAQSIDNEDSAAITYRPEFALLSTLAITVLGGLSLY